MEKNANRAFSVYARTLHVAADRLGSEEQLAKALGVQSLQLACWLSDVQPPPRSTFLKALAIVIGKDAPGQ